MATYSEIDEALDIIEAIRAVESCAHPPERLYRSHGRHGRLRCGACDEAKPEDQRGD